MRLKIYNLYMYDLFFGIFKNYIVMNDRLRYLEKQISIIDILLKKTRCIPFLVTLYIFYTTCIIIKDYAFLFL